ncbi:MAG: 50S ribosome-binding GTPase [Desulfovibrio sp.]|nr:50S ribosome-binding GTPase [Desulfovibrio sp.]
MSNYDIIELRKASQELIEKFTRSNQDKEKFNVVIVGQYNNGKSSLCNALMKDYSNSRFAVSDKRETRKIQEETDPANGVTYIDTPGFDSTHEEDTRLARDAWIRANLIIFVHSLRAGELDGNEVDTLRTLFSVVPDLGKRFFLVCSKKGEIDADNAEEIGRKVRAQVMDYIGGISGYAIVDSNDYMEGLKDDDRDLVIESGIDTVYEWIANHRSAQSVAEKMLEEEKNKIERMAHRTRDNLDKGIKNYKRGFKDRRMKLDTVWTNAKPGISKVWDLCSGYKK